MSDPASHTGPVLNVAVVGCGEVAQIVHLPNLSLAGHMYRLTALCDVSAQCLAHCGERYHVPPEARFSDLTKETMLTSPLPLPIDLIFILSPSELHVSQSLLCLKHGKHLFIEKPLANTLAEVDELERAAERAGQVVFVGYMRRYAGGVELVKDRLKGKVIRYARVRELIGSNPMFTSQSGTYPVYPTDIPASASEEIKGIRHQSMLTNFGEHIAADERTAGSWSILTNLASHDISAMREILGSPRGVEYASRSGVGPGSGWWNVVFDYGDFKAQYEMGIDDVPLFDAHIEVYTAEERIRIQYDTPYIKGLPITVQIQSRLPSGEYSSQTLRTTYEDPYTLEMRELYEAVVRGKPVRTSVKDARRDTELAIEIIKALKP